MNNLKRFNENLDIKEYILLTHHESGDEIHFSLIESSLYSEIEKVIGYEFPKIEDINKMLETIFKNRIKHLVCQSYVLEEWPFSGYNIIKCINLPELGM